VNFIEWRPHRGSEPRHCLLERWDYDGDAGAFQRASTRPLGLA
jgi:hypothetical protein